jgi:hypothetical protein
MVMYTSVSCFVLGALMIACAQPAESLELDSDDMEIVVGSGEIRITTDGEVVRARGRITYSSRDAAEVFQHAIDGLDGVGGTITVDPGRYMFANTVKLWVREVHINRTPSRSSSPTGLARR